MSIAPIETQYNGFLFRSRLEARWAVFFDTLNIEYRYEPEGYDLDGIWYLPDFYLPKLRYWIEIKADLPTPEERQKAIMLAQATQQLVFIFAGDIWHTVQGLGFLSYSLTREEVEQVYGQMGNEIAVYWLSSQECITYYPPDQFCGFDLSQDFIWTKASWGECTQCSKVDIATSFREKEHFHKCEAGFDIQSLRLMEAFKAARQARF